MGHQVRGQVGGIGVPPFGSLPFGTFPWPGYGLVILRGSPQATLTLAAEYRTTITLRGHEEV